MPDRTLAPPEDGLHPTIIVHGRSYTCASGQTIVAPDFDAVVMEANGWAILGAAMVLGLQSVAGDGTTLSLDPATGDIYQATGD